MTIRTIDAAEITAAVKKLLMDCNYYIGKDIFGSLEAALEIEDSPVAQSVLRQIIENDKIAADEEIPLCQDTGMAVLFVEYGDKVCVANGSFEDAVQQGVREAYTDGYLRKSVVSDPVFDRVNTRDNTPAVIHTKIVGGTSIRITAGGKGFGSENMSAIKMLTPAYGAEGVAKKATFRPIDTCHPDERYAAMERELLTAINQMGFGPAGLGGKTTALGVNIETSPTHIAGMPVAVNICCHAARHASTVI